MVRIGLLIALTALVPTVAAAQDSSHWGVAVSVTPEWKIPTQFKPLFDGDTVDISSHDFSIGIARGKTLSGDWSLSYIRKNIKDGSIVSSIDQDCTSFTNGCFRYGSTLLTRGVTVTGIRALKFVPFATIKRRVQIGMNLGGGVGTFNGSLEAHDYHADPVAPFDSSGRSRAVQRDVVSTEDAKELFGLSVVPLGSVELAVGVIVAPGFKVRVAGGLDFPGYNTFNITGVYLFGAK